MRAIFPVLLITLSIYIYACANQGTPTGGPRDTIPPTLLETLPINKSTNYKNKQFKFVFNERVSADKLKSQLLITPHIENKYSVKVRKNELTLDFDDDFNDSTTYTLNFSEGVVDLTEKNPVVNLTFAFSTGQHIDSIYINGKVTDLYTNKSQSQFIVGLYPLTDSTNLLEDKPRYFAKTNEQGQYLIENIKNGYYKILTFEDQNKNLTLDPETEPHGFLADSTNLNLSLDSIRLYTQLINASSFKFIRSKTTGRYFDLQYNKPVFSININKADSSENLNLPWFNKIKSNKTIRFYPDTTFRYDIDSLKVIVHAVDSMSNQTIDTVHVKFIESSRKAETFSYKLSPQSGSFIRQNVLHTYTFNKPIKTFNKDSIKIHYDSLAIQGIPDSTIEWNINRTKLQFETFIDQNYLKSQIDTLLKIYSDTTLTDSVSLLKKDYYSQVKTNQITIAFPKGTFISLEDDSTEAVRNTHKFNSLDQLGSIAGTINSSHQSYILQLVNPKYEVIEEIINPKQFSFTHVKPGKYTFRIMIDTNQDGTWSYGNILQDRTPEEIYFYPEIFDVRANWELENIQITF
ncbi:MAG: Ig-like domain-containing protein [Reichenbachiella sp.]|uniref:Ig-like domain-containing protein n=1 Tax=Reichenbachiella sp. TaxID=2184521 RepID=UPI0032654245